MEGEALGAVLVGRLRPVRRCFAFPTVEADEVAGCNVPARDLGAIEPGKHLDERASERLSVHTHGLGAGDCFEAT